MPRKKAHGDHGRNFFRFAEFVLFVAIYAALSKARHEKGTLIASGFIAGGALVGVLTALLRFLEQNWNVSIIPDLVKTCGPWLEEWHNWIGLIMFLLLSVGLYLDSHRERV